MMTPLHFKKFNEKVQAMNQSHSNEIKLSAQDARALHGAMFSLLEELNSLKAQDVDEIMVSLDAGPNSLIR